MITKHECINTLKHPKHIYNHVWVFDKTTDRIVATMSMIPDENTKAELSVSSEHVQEMLNEPINLEQVTDNDPSNLGLIYICDSNQDLIDVRDFCVENGELVKQYQLVLECDAEDEDMDGIPDIEGDGISVANFTLKVTDMDTSQLISSYNGTAKITTQRGKIIGGQTGFINIVSGVGTFQLRSVPESVDQVSVKAFLTIDRLIPHMRAQIATLEISFK